MGGEGGSVVDEGEEKENRDWEGRTRREIIEGRFFGGFLADARKQAKGGFGFLKETRLICNLQAWKMAWYFFVKILYPKEITTSSCGTGHEVAQLDTSCVYEHLPSYLL